MLKSYTVNDTLKISDLRTYTDLKVAGPFTSGEVYNAPNAVPVSSSEYNYESLSFRIYYKLNNDPELLKRHTTKVCEQSEVVIDLN